MSNYVNYLVEANFSLVIFFAAYTLVLRKETDFSLQRLFLLAGIVASLFFPFIHISYSQPHLPSLSELIPSFLLPELTIGGQSVAGSQTPQASINIRYLVELIYVAGLLFFLIRFVFQLLQLMRKMNSATSYRVGACNVVESGDSNHTFSFFNFIFLGQSNALTADEKKKVIQHEAVHARRFHSFDLLLINVVGILFWFNPVIKLYKELFVQLHEFEADARAVDSRDTNVYCSLLAKVALQSSDFPLANHFNSSLTLRRITMMRTIKQKMKRWKMIMVASTIPIVFFVVACQDQVVTDAQQLVRSHIPSNLPAEVQSIIDELENTPEKKFVVIETTTEAGKATLATIKEDEITSIQVITPTALPNEALRTFFIVELNDQNGGVEDKVYTIVDETAMPVGGMTEFYNYVAKNLKYPADARKKGIEGKVFVEFNVDSHGEIDVTGISGIGAGCDLEAMRVVQSAQKWIPGKKDGIPVKQHMVLPINFSLAGSTYQDPAKSVDDAMPESVVVGNKIQ